MTLLSLHTTADGPDLEQEHMRLGARCVVGLAIITLTTVGKTHAWTHARTQRRTHARLGVIYAQSLLIKLYNRVSRGSN